MTIATEDGTRQVVLCTRMDLVGKQTAPLNTDDLTDEQAYALLGAIWSTFAGFLDDRPVLPFFEFSTRALNIMRRHNVVTVGELKQLVMRCKGSSGIHGAGRLVLTEWEAALHNAAGRGRT